MLTKLCSTFDNPASLQDQYSLDWQHHFFSKPVSMIKIRHITTLLVILCALFSGQTMAGTPGHKYFYVQNADSQLRHNGDSEELRVTTFNAAEEYRERHQKYLRGFERNIIH